MLRVKGQLLSIWLGIYEHIDVLNVRGWVGILVTRSLTFFNSIPVLFLVYLSFSEETRARVMQIMMILRQKIICFLSS
jgi:hypothetical protein